MYLYIDIETIPGQRESVRRNIELTIAPPKSLKKPESIAKWYAEHADDEIEKRWRATALDGALGEVQTIAWTIDDGAVRSMNRTLMESEKTLLIKFLLALREDLDTGHSDHAMKPVWVGHFITGFDLRFIWQRCVIHDVHPPIAIPYKARPWDSNIFDTKIEWTGITSGYTGSGKLDAVCKALGLPGKPDDIDGSKVWDFIKAGRYAEVEAYGRDDVEKVRLVHKRMTFSC